MAGGEGPPSGQVAEHHTTRAPQGVSPLAGRGLSPCRRAVQSCPPCMGSVAEEPGAGGGRTGGFPWNWDPTVPGPPRSTRLTPIQGASHSPRTRGSPLAISRRLTWKDVVPDTKSLSMGQRRAVHVAETSAAPAAARAHALLHQCPAGTLPDFQSILLGASLPHACIRA